MGAYVASGQDTSTASTTIIQVRQPATALKRLKLTYLQIGSDASADNAYEAVLQRTTANGTDGSTPTAQPRDPADGAASATVGVAHSAEPTYTASAIQLPVFGHQRATFQWYAAPGHEIVVAVTNAAGIGLQIITCASAFNMGAVIEWEE